jgi:type II pantothenate kinase
MSIIVGIDVGGSTTKIVGFDGETLLSPLLVKANDPIASVYGAFDKFTSDNGINLSDIKKVMVTGVGSAFLGDNIYGIETVHVNEFLANGLGGLYLSKINEAVIVSMGTGTAMVHANADGRMDYLGGTGVGGGTLLGLSRLILSADTVSHIEEYAETGDLKNVDLRIGDITAQGKSSVLPRDLTASNFGNLSDLATKEDLSLGILNMVYETVGMISVFAARSVGVENIVLTGNLTRLAFCRQKFDFFNSMKDTYGMSFIIPKRSEYATVIGTAIHGL